MNSAIKCHGCGAEMLEPMIDFGQQPVAHRLLSGPDEKEATFPFALAVCRCCALVQVPEPAPPEELYNGFNFNFSSWKSEPHQDDELLWLCGGGVPRSVCEIGANDGRFLSLLRDQGAANCVAIEPNPVPAQVARERGLEVIPGFLTPTLADNVVATHGQFELVVFRQVLEHVPRVPEFLEGVRRLLAPNGRIFIDLPDFSSSVLSGDASTLWEEHANYFTEQTLTRTLARAGFDIVDVRRYDFSGGCLATISRHGKTGKGAVMPATDDELASAREYAKDIRDYRDRMRQALAAMRSRGWAIALYGAGVRACSFANFLQLGSAIDVAIDDQPERQGHYLPGARVPIRALTDVLAGPKGTIFLLAVNNENEHKVMLKISARPERTLVFTVCGPRDVWGDLERLEQGLM